MANEFTKVIDLINDLENADSTVLEVCFGGDYNNIHLTSEQAKILVPAPSVFLEEDKEVILREVGDPYGPDILKIVYKLKGEFPSDLAMTSSALKYGGVYLPIYDKETADPTTDENCIYSVSTDQKPFERTSDSLIWRCKVNKSINPVLENFSCNFEYKDANNSKLDYGLLSEAGLSSVTLINDVLEEGENALAIVKPIPPFPYFSNGDIVTWNIYGGVGTVDKYKGYNKIVYNEDGSTRNSEDFNLVPAETELSFSFSWPQPLFGGNDFKSRTFKFTPTVETEYRTTYSLKYYYHTDQFIQPINDNTYIWSGLIMPNSMPEEPSGVYWVYEHDLINGTSRKVAYNLDF